MALNYSKIANLGFRMDCNILLDIFGTSKISTKSGPLDPLFITEYVTEYKQIQHYFEYIMFAYINIS